MVTMRGIGRICGWTTLALVASLAAASAQDAEKAFFAGKTVRIVVGSGVGGGYDVYSRLIAPYLAKVLGTTVVVENQPGAGGLISLNKLYVTEPDGLTMSFANGTSAAFSEITEQQGRHFELAKFDFLATIGAPPGLWLVAPDSPIKTVQQAIDAKKTWRWGASGPADGLGNGAAFTCAALKLDCKIVPGYRGSNEAGLAVTRGEMDAIYVPESSAYNFVQAGKNIALATMARKKSRWFPNEPTIYEVVKLDADGQWLLDFYTGVEGMGRVLILPPGVPKARLAFLQAAVKETMHNPKLIDEGERAGRIMEYLDPQTTHANALELVKITPEQRKRVEQIAARK
jgi:tripartite-type tricarboxylate transporter receptor subunit TctC